MSFGVKYDTMLSRVAKGMNLHKACTGRGTPSYDSARGRLKRNTDGIREAYEKAVADGQDKRP